MNILRNLAIVVSLLFGTVALPFAYAPTAGAINVFKECRDNDDKAVCQSKGTDTVGSLVRTIISTMLLVIGAVSVVMIIVGGLRYTLSNGDASQIKSAKDTVLYAVIGLVVALLAYAIVQFVINQFKTP